MVHCTVEINFYEDKKNPAHDQNRKFMLFRKFGDIQ